MPRDTTRDLRKMGRRNFVKTLAGLGMSRSALEYMTKDRLKQLTDDPSNQIPILAYKKHTNHEEYVNKLNTNNPVRPKREPIYELVPRDRWLTIEAINNAAHTLRKQLGARNINQVSVGVTSVTSGQKSKKVIFVSHNTLREQSRLEKPNISYSKLRELLPATINGSAGHNNNKRIVEDIDVELRRSIAGQDAYYDKNYRPVPGGCAIENVGGGNGTMGTIAYDSDIGDNAWVTAGHLVNGSNSPLYQNEATSDYIGQSTNKTEASYKDFDAAVIERADGIYIKGDIASNGWFEDYEDWPIHGVVGWDRIKNNQGNTNFTLYRQGQTSGRDGGHITEYTDSTLSIDVSRAGGDSGGPYFEIVDGKSYIAGIHAWPTDGGSRAMGTGMEPIEDEWGITV